MSLVLDEFYQNLRTVGVSSMTGAGMDEFTKAVDDAVVEFETQYKPGKMLFNVTYAFFTAAPKYVTMFKPNTFPVNMFAISLFALVVNFKACFTPASIVYTVS